MVVVVLSAPRQALVRGRGGSRFAARGHSGSQVLRRASSVTGLSAEGQKALKIQIAKVRAANPRDRRIQPNRRPIASLRV